MDIAQWESLSWPFYDSISMWVSSCVILQHCHRIQLLTLAPIWEWLLGNPDGFSEIVLIFEVLPLLVHNFTKQRFMYSDVIVIT